MKEAKRQLCNKWFWKTTGSSPWTENHIKWVKALYSTFKVLKWLEENRGQDGGGYNMLFKTLGSAEFPEQSSPSIASSPSYQQMREQPEIETLHAQKRKLPEEQRAYGMEDIFTSCTPDKGLITWVYKELQKLHSKEIQLPINQWANSSDVLQKKKHRWPITVFLK